jgi:hypothetical protein
MEDDKAKELTQAEIVRLKKIAKEDERMEWLWSTVRSWSAYIAGILAALIAFRDDLGKVLKWITGG